MIDLKPKNRNQIRRKDDREEKNWVKWVQALILVLLIPIGSYVFNIHATVKEFGYKIKANTQNTINNRKEIDDIENAFIVTQTNQKHIMDGLNVLKSMVSDLQKLKKDKP